MKRFVAVLLVAGVLGLAGGCLETEESYTLNPDGSGKVAVKFILQPVDIFGQEEEDPEAQVRDVLKKTLEESKGVDAWKDVACKQTEDGRIRFSGTAYFKDISKLKFKYGNVDMKMGTTSPSFTRNPDGSMVLELKEAGNDERKSDKTDTPRLTEKQIARKIKAARAQYQQAKLMMTAFASGLKIKATYRLPGTLGQVTNFKKNDDGTVGLRIEGEKMLEAFDKLMSDDAWCRKQVIAGRNILEDGPPGTEMNKELFGEKATIRAVVTGRLNPLFDYKTEVAEAKKNYPKLLKKLGIETQVPVQFAKGEGFKKIRVGGVRLVRFADTRNDVRPFNGHVGYTLCLIGELPGSVQNVERGMLEKAVADNGDSLLPEREWDRKIHFPRLSKDKTTVIFEVKLLLPGENVKSLKEVSGTLEYLVSSGSRDVDLGIEEFKAGAKGKKFGASITAVGANQWDKKMENLSLKLNLSRDTVKSVTFYDKDGEKLDVSRQGYMSSGSTTTFEYSIKGNFPRKGCIVVQVFEKLERHKIPFKISSISLAGQPLK